MATTNGSTAIRDKILASLARYRALRIGKFPCAFWRLSARPGLTADESILAVVFLKSLQTRALNYSSLQSGAFDFQVSGYWKTKL
ncbi:hypothetical protein [Bathymodiolus japonicus methanotrophic gill symbiont]|uniref:hypothetical protein n=1 Tax=Bathymodiolus japonicus methanotrophic gill symbiont TaxID=113269 RepID=UPI001C8E7D46|nr:hypothetical protein [Bathymodiolus japonicus methanotrophic gill symbiont]